jgi:hypothetical protein
MMPEALLEKELAASLEAPILEPLFGPLEPEQVASLETPLEAPSLELAEVP